MCAPKTQNNVALLLYSHLVYINWAVRYLHEAFLCMNIYLVLDQMQIMSQYLQSNQIEEKDSLWLNLLMSRLPFIRNQLLIQIHTLMFL